MSPIRSVLVHLDGTARAAARLQFAHRLAATHKARLDALFAVTPRFLPLPVPLGDGMPAVPLLDEVDPRHRADAKALFDRTVAEGAQASSWHELDTSEAPIAGFVRRALLADLLVLGQRDAADATGFDVPADFVEAVVIDSGRPALIVPFEGEVAEVPQTVLIAWKPTRESAHAVTAALPFLQRARTVHAVCDGDDVVDAHQALAELAHYLRWHGIAATHDHHTLPEIDVGSGLLGLARHVGAELLVMGCYGHSRARELVLGGASRGVLRATRVPVLMAH